MEFSNESWFHLSCVAPDRSAWVHYFSVSTMNFQSDWDSDWLRATSMSFCAAPEKKLFTFLAPCWDASSSWRTTSSPDRFPIDGRRNVSRIKVTISTVPGFFPIACRLAWSFTWPATLYHQSQANYQFCRSYRTHRGLKFSFSSDPQKVHSLRNKQESTRLKKRRKKSGKYHVWVGNLIIVSLRLENISGWRFQHRLFVQCGFVIHHGRSLSSDHPHTSWLRHFGLL